MTDQKRSTGQERRQESRVPFTGAVRDYSEPSAAPWKAIDLSENGISVTGTGLLAVGREIEIGFDVPGYALEVATNARVVWVNARGIPGYEARKPEAMGLRFIEMDPEYDKVVRDYIADRRAAQIKNTGAKLAAVDSELMDLLEAAAKPDAAPKQTPDPTATATPQARPAPARTPAAPPTSAGPAPVRAAPAPAAKPADPPRVAPRAAAAKPPAAPPNATPAATARPAAPAPSPAPAAATAKAPPAAPARPAALAASRSDSAAASVNEPLDERRLLGRESPFAPARRPAMAESEIAATPPDAPTEAVPAATPVRAPAPSPEVREGPVPAAAVAPPAAAPAAAAPVAAPPVAAATPAAAAPVAATQVAAAPVAAAPVAAAPVATAPVAAAPVAAAPVAAAPVAAAPVAAAPVAAAPVAAAPVVAAPVAAAPVSAAPVAAAPVAAAPVAAAPIVATPIAAAPPVAAAPVALATPAAAKPAASASPADIGIESDSFDPFVADDAAQQENKELLPQGAVLGSFQILRWLGSGGMGDVYLAEHSQLGRRVAIKRLRSEFATNRLGLKRFFDEARAVNKIRHENIVEITDFVATTEHTYCVMEYLDGVTLAELQARRLAAPGMPRGLPIEQVLRIAVQICSALAAVHSAGIVHRDLKPQNIMIVDFRDGRDLVKLLDFGVAKLKGPEDGGKIRGKSQSQSTGSSLIGTPGYMSPEQLLGRPVDHRADIYALGVILYQMTTGTNPFVADTWGQAVVNHATTVPPRPSESKTLAAQVPEELEVLILQCLEKDPARRPATVGEVGDRLRAVAERSPGHAVIAKGSGKRPRSRVMRVIFGMAATAALLSGGFFAARLPAAQRLLAQLASDTTAATPSGSQSGASQPAPSASAPAAPQPAPSSTEAATMAAATTPVAPAAAATPAPTPSTPGAAAGAVATPTPAPTAPESVPATAAAAPADDRRPARGGGDTRTPAPASKALRRPGESAEARPATAAAPPPAAAPAPAAAAQPKPTTPSPPPAPPPTPAPAAPAPAPAAAAATAPPAAAGGGEGGAPSEAEARYEEGKSLLKSNKPLLAVQEFQKSIAANPNLAKTYRMLGQAYVLLGREEEAIAAFEKFVQLAPNHKDAPSLRKIIADYRNR